MRKMNIVLDETTKQIVCSDLALLNKPYNKADHVFNIASTFHHETGERAYMPGYHPISQSPAYTLVDTGEMTIGLFMDIEEMDVFENSSLSWRDGYIILNRIEE